MQNPNVTDLEIFKKNPFRRINRKTPNINNTLYMQRIEHTHRRFNNMSTYLTWIAYSGTPNIWKWSMKIRKSGFDFSERKGCFSRPIAFFRRNCFFNTMDYRRLYVKGKSEQEKSFDFERMKEWAYLYVRVFCMPRFESFLLFYSNIWKIHLI